MTGWEYPKLNPSELTSEWDADAARVFLAAIEEAIAELPAHSKLRRGFQGDAIRLRTRLAEWDARPTDQGTR